MFERLTLTELLATVAGAAAIIYLGWEIRRRQEKLRDLFFVLNGDDRQITDELEALVSTGLLRPYAAGVTA